VSEAACEVVRRYLTDALFGGDEHALVATVADGTLQERAWLFWAAFSERSLDEVDVLFADATGELVACHLTGSAVQVGPWMTASSLPSGGPVTLECTAIYTLVDGRIANFQETWR
jgi:hypothetical protein